MKILLLADIPPCKELTAGLVLDRLCRFLPKGSIACFAVIDPAIKETRVSKDLNWIPAEYHDKPRETWDRFGGKLAFLDRLLSFGMELYNEITTVNKIADKAVEFGKKFDADILWCVIQGQTEIRLAKLVSERLGVPLLVQIWDPPYWWLDAHGVDGYSKKRILKKFEYALKKSRCVATASWAMAERYREDYGAKAVPMLPGLDRCLGILPATAIHEGNDFIIGSAGKVYPAEVWRALFRALDTAGWKVQGRDVKIRVLARKASVHLESKGHVEFLGWRPQGEAVKVLSGADVLYCPYWFDPYFETVTRLSFPGKLSTFLASGRPVLFHGPDNASPAKFLKENEAGLLCNSMDSKRILDCLEMLASDSGLYARLATNGRHAFDKYLTHDSMRESFAEFLGVDESFFVDG